jgi:ABC-type sugar transport system ATPase subunit
LEHEGIETPYLQARISPQQTVQRGDQIGLAINPEQVHIFEAQSGVALLPA